MPATRQFDLNDWVDHIQSQHWRTIDLELDRVQRVWQRLGGRLPGHVVAVAGTNGKGSSVAMLESAYLAAGLKTGTFTSPHLVRYNERVRLNGEQASDGVLCQGFQAIEEARRDIPLTYFEYSTLCALLLFRDLGAEVCLLEVGMGGRLDAVNIIDNDIALLTSVGIDHAQWLGPDRESIGREKAGIFKAGRLAVCADPAPPESVSRVAADVSCTLFSAGRDFRIEHESDGLCWRSDSAAIDPAWQAVTGLKLHNDSDRQRNNLGGVIATLALGADQTGVRSTHLVEGLSSLQLPGRRQVIQERPRVILDVAHNADAVGELAAFLEQRPVRGSTSAVLGMLGDKAIDDVYEPISACIDRWYLATLTGDRGQSAETLGRRLQAAGCTEPVVICPDPVSAYRSAMESAGAEDRVVAFGSFHTVGDIIGHLETEGA